MSQSKINNINKNESNTNNKKNKSFSNSTPLPKKNKNTKDSSNTKNKTLNLKKKRINNSKILSLEYLKRIRTSEKKQKAKKNLDKNKKTKELLLGEKHKSITAYEKEYEKLNNLCKNKKNNRSKDEINEFIKKQHTQLLKQKREQSKQRADKNIKIFISFEKLQRKIQKQKKQIKPKTPSINRFFKKNPKKKEDEDSNGSKLNANDMKKDFYIKCIDTMRIYTPYYEMNKKKVNLNKNVNEANNAKLKLLLFNNHNKENKS